jgi:small-conductance mechanosensitive channel
MYRLLKPWEIVLRIVAVALWGYCIYLLWSKGLPIFAYNIMLTLYLGATIITTTETVSSLPSS